MWRAAGSFVGEVDQLAAVEVGGEYALGAGQFVVHAAGQAHPLLPQRPGLQAGPLLRVGDDAEVAAAGSGCLGHRGRRFVLDLHVEFGSLELELGPQLVEERDAGGVDRVDPHGAAARRNEARDAARQGVVAADQFAPLAGHELAGGSQHEGPPGAVEKPRAEELFQVLDPLADRRLGDPVKLGCTAEAAQVGDVAEDAEPLHRKCRRLH